MSTPQSKADTALEAAISARETNNFNEAADAYSEALTQYRAALNQLDADATETRTEIEESIDSTREALHAVNTRIEQRDSVSELLEAGEQSFQVAIVAYTQGRHTLARIRFRQARDAFEEAIDLLEDNGEDLLTPPVEVGVQLDRELESTDFSELPMIPEAETAALADAGVETLTELDSSETPPWVPPAVEPLTTEESPNEEVITTLTLLSWWAEASTAFDTVTAVSRRRDQANYGFTQST
jgi:tetratricopeptide (TPR) repeat protein